MNQPLPWPPEWPLTDFPQPNPYFPPLPREGRLPLPYEKYGKYVLIASGVLLLVATACMYLEQGGTKVFAAVFGGASAISFIVGLVVVTRNEDSQHWNLGVILPAIVAREGRGGGMEDAVLVGLGSAVGVGPVANVATAGQAAVVEYVTGGRICQAAITVSYGVGSVIWLVMWSTNRVLREVAPPPFDREAPGADVRAWLQAALDLARRHAGFPVGRQPAGRPPAPQAPEPQRQSRNMADRPPW